MKKTSILLIALSLFAMIFSGCSMLVPDKTTATIEDFQGTWVWTEHETNTSDQISKGTIVAFQVELNGNSITFTDDLGASTTQTASVENGVLTTYSRLYGTFNITVKATKTMITLTGDKLPELFGKQVIYLSKRFEVPELPLVPDTSAEFKDFKGSWTNNSSSIRCIFDTESLTGKNLATVQIIGLNDDSFALPNLVIIAKGVATTTVNDNVYLIYINKEHTKITITGPALKQITGDLFLNLDKRN